MTLDDGNAKLRDLRMRCEKRADVAPARYPWDEMVRWIDTMLVAELPPESPRAEPDQSERIKALEQERARLAVQVGNAEQGDCLLGEFGNIECRHDNPCGVCALRQRAEKAEAALAEAQKDVDRLLDCSSDCDMRVYMESTIRTLSRLLTEARR